jgi:hypothetical protein
MGGRQVEFRRTGGHPDPEVLWAAGESQTGVGGGLHFAVKFCTGPGTGPGTGRVGGWAGVGRGRIPPHI